MCISHFEKLTLSKHFPSFLFIRTTGAGGSGQEALKHPHPGDW